MSDKRTYQDKCVSCHRETESGILQLSCESVIEKRGEFGETPLFSKRVIPSQVFLLNEGEKKV